MPKKNKTTKTLWTLIIFLAGLIALFFISKGLEGLLPDLNPVVSLLVGFTILILLIVVFHKKM